MTISIQLYSKNTVQTKRSHLELLRTLGSAIRRQRRKITKFTKWTNWSNRQIHWIYTINDECSQYCDPLHHLSAFNSPELIEFVKILNYGERIYSHKLTKLVNQCNYESGTKGKFTMSLLKMICQTINSNDWLRIASTGFIHRPVISAADDDRYRFISLSRLLSTQNWKNSARQLYCSALFC